MTARMNAVTMVNLGFLVMPAAEAHKRFPIASESGDDVWWHPGQDPQIWFQGLPDGEQLFNAIYRNGKRAGVSQKLRELHDALGLP